VLFPHNSAVHGLHNFLMHEAQGMVRQGAAPFAPEDDDAK
jgi:hypothetical protein